MQSRYSVCMEVFQEFPITLFETNDTKMWVSGTKKKDKDRFREERNQRKKHLSDNFHFIFYMFFCILGRILIFVKDIEASSTAK